jgi:hypothetical protein
MDLLEEQLEIFEFRIDTKYSSIYNNYLNVPLICLRKFLLQFIMEAFLTASWCIWKQTVFFLVIDCTPKQEVDYPTFTKDKKQVYIRMI